MNDAASESRCPTCGAPLPARTPGSLCPKCLLLQAAAPTATGAAPPPGRPEPPSLERVARAFPQLEILEWIGQGGMGCVFKARQRQLERLVALKILPESLAREPAFAERFAREARALAALNHPNIVTIHDFGQSDGLFFLLMEFVDGVNLRQLIRSQRLSPEQALTIVPPLCDALQFAHERGIVHRDIKPENLLLDRSGRIKVADFGIARMLASDGPERGSTAASGAGRQSLAAGTPGYMAPEQQATPATVDRRADIYALGVVLYEMLTGELPATSLQPPSRKVQVDVRLDEIVLRALDRSPELRYQTAAEFRTAVETLATAAPKSTPAPPADSTQPTLTASQVKKGEFLGLGAGVQAVGLALCFLGSWGAIPGILLLLIGGRLAIRRLCSHCGNPTSRHARQCAACGAAFVRSRKAGASLTAQVPVDQSHPRPSSWAKAWLELGSRKRLAVRVALFSLGLLLSLNFVSPHRSSLGDGSILVWTAGLTQPWLAEISRQSAESPLTAQRESRLHFDRFSYLCGPLALTLWLLLTNLRRIESGSGWGEWLQPADALGPLRVRWARTFLGWLGTSAMTATATFLLMPPLHFALGLPMMPLGWLTAALIINTLAVATTLIRSRFVHPPLEAPSRP